MDKKQIKRGRKIVLVVLILLSIGIYSLIATNSKEIIVEKKVVIEKINETLEKKVDENLEKKEEKQKEVKEIKLIIRPEDFYKKGK